MLMPLQQPKYPKLLQHRIQLISLKSYVMSIIMLLKEIKSYQCSQNLMNITKKMNGPVRPARIVCGVVGFDNFPFGIPIKKTNNKYHMFGKLQL